MAKAQLLLVLSVLALVGACSSPTVTTSEFSSDQNTARQEAEDNALRGGAAHVTIFGASIIRLPPTPGVFDASADNERAYDFTVYSPTEGSGQSIAQRLSRGELKVDVVGADATITPVAYGMESSTAISESKDALRVRLTSAALGPSVKIIAYLPERAQEWASKQAAKIEKARKDLNAALNQDKNPSVKGADASLLKDLTSALDRELTRKNPFSAIHDVQVFNGDLYTDIQVLDKKAAEDSFGKEFTKYFFVARARFSNRQDTRSLIVNTTSMRARVVFYRRPFFPAKISGYNDIANRARAMMSRSSVDVTKYDSSTKTGLSRELVSEYLRVAIKYYDSPEAAGKTDNIRTGGPSAAVNKFAEGKSLTEAQKSELRFIAVQLYSAIDREFFKANYNDRDTFIQYVRSFRPEENNDKDHTSKRPEWYNKVFESLTKTEAESFGTAPIFMSEASPGGLFANEIASSPNIFMQSHLAAAGYPFYGYYRPMTLASVIVSLVERTNAAPENRLLRLMESAGIVAAGLTGLEKIGTVFGTRTYSQYILVSTSILLPEARRLLLQDVGKYLKNLGNLALDTTFELPANSSRDGYLFFPRSALYGYGVDEFSITEPSYIVGIDRSALAVEGKIVESSVQIGDSNPGVDNVGEGAQLHAAMADAGAPLNVRVEHENTLRALKENLRIYEGARLRNDVDKLLAEKSIAAAKNKVAVYRATYGDDTLVQEINTKIGAEEGYSTLHFGDKEDASISRKFGRSTKPASGDWTYKLAVRLSDPLSDPNYNASIRAIVKDKEGHPIDAITITPASVSISQNDWAQPQEFIFQIDSQKLSSDTKFNIDFLIATEDRRFPGHVEFPIELIKN